MCFIKLNCINTIVFVTMSSAKDLAVLYNHCSITIIIMVIMSVRIIVYFSHAPVRMSSHTRRGNVSGRFVSGRGAWWRATEGCTRGSHPRAPGPFNTRLNNINYRKTSAVVVAKKIRRPLYGAYSFPQRLWHKKHICSIASADSGAELLVRASSNPPGKQFGRSFVHR